MARDAGGEATARWLLGTGQGAHNREVLGGQIVVEHYENEANSVQNLYGEGPLTALFRLHKQSSGGGHEVDHWARLQSWVPRVPEA
eukprot:9372204-Pyramimonas_sp.AAC.1